MFKNKIDSLTIKNFKKKKEHSLDCTQNLASKEVPVWVHHRPLSTLLYYSHSAPYSLLSTLYCVSVHDCMKTKNLKREESRNITLDDIGYFKHTIIRPYP